MVYPITKKSFTIDRADVYVTRHYEVQKPPYSLCLEFDARVAITKQLYGQTSQPANQSWPLDSANGQVPGNILVAARNRSYNKLVSKLGDASSLGATLTAERRETWGMLVTLITRALSAARNIKKLNFSAAARDLGLPYRERTRVRKYQVVLRKKKDGSHVKRIVRIKETYFDWGTGRMRLKTLANGWLMYSYGIKPFMGDMYNCMDVLQMPFPYSRIYGANTQSSTRLDVYKPPSSFPGSLLRDLKVSVRQSIEVRVQNPNLWLANRMGLVNPLQWLNEAIPFSFVVDWFSNLSDVIASLTDFVGLETQKPCTNLKAVFIEDLVGSNPYNPPTDRNWRSVRTTIYTSRVRAIYPPVLKFQYERFQWQRGLNAISLLIGFLRSR